MLIPQRAWAPVKNHKSIWENGYHEQNKMPKSDSQRLQVLSYWVLNVEINVLNLSEETNGRNESMSQG